MPIFADVLVKETSVNTGCAEGKEAPTVTWLLLPLTEIVAVVTLALEAGARAPVVTVAGVVAASGEVGGVGAAFELESHDAAAAALESEPHVETCCLKGSLVLKSLNETS